MLKNNYKTGHWLLALLLLLPLPLLGGKEDVRIELHLEPPHLDPTQTPAATVAEATYHNIFQGLTRINRKGEVEPLLAQTWKISEDGLRYDFYLQPGVVFHNQQPFTAEVAAFSLTRLLNPEAGNPQRNLYSSIREINPRGSHRLELVLNRPDSLLLFRLGLSAAVMVEPSSAATNKQHPVGTGPYEFVSWRVGQSLELQAFPNYWHDQPEIRRASLTFTSNRIELEASLTDGEVDFYPNISPMASVKRLADRGDYQINDGVTEGQTLLVFNHAHPALADLRVRRAINHAVDKRRLLDIFPKASPALIGSHFSPLHPAYVDLVDFYPHNPDKARKLLEEAGYAQGLKLRFKVPPPLYAQQLSLYLVDDLEKVGIQVDLERISWTEWLQQVFRESNYDLTVIAHVEPLDMDIYARDDYYFNFKSEAFQKLWRQIETTQDEALRNQLFVQAQKYLAEQAAQVYLHIKPQQSIRKVGLEGFWENAPIPAVVISELYWDN
ncbi:ABC transporter substrate-binding protein [Marinospirillum sp.]|uniref:ABC transporter substrate-binding protein n=1 Tax=Marinospirillum sp. TaxID=2183934 RepID=UPI00384B0698